MYSCPAHGGVWRGLNLQAVCRLNASVARKTTTNASGTPRKLSIVYSLYRSGKLLLDRPAPYVIDDRKLERVPDAAVIGERITPWNAPDHLEQLAELPTVFDMPLGACAQRYGQVPLPANDRGWRFHLAQKFTKRR